MLAKLINLAKLLSLVPNGLWGNGEWQKNQSHVTNANTIEEFFNSLPKSIRSVE